MARKKILIANWKLNHHQDSARDFFRTLKAQLLASTKVECAVAPVAPMLAYVGALVNDLPIALAAQNVFFEAKGPFTGEWSVQHLKEIGVRYCIVGHSERRSLFGENDDMVLKKAKACVMGGVKPVICVGESLAERDALKTEAVIERQVMAVVKGLGESANEALHFAYEPIWAIGTGKTATREQAVTVHQFIRGLLQKSMGEGLAQQSRILYGGSVTAQNISEMAKSHEVDGALVGGASLQAESFLSMVKSLHDVL